MEIKKSFWINIYDNTNCADRESFGQVFPDTWKLSWIYIKRSENHGTIIVIIEYRMVGEMAYENLCIKRKEITIE